MLVPPMLLRQRRRLVRGAVSEADQRAWEGRRKVRCSNCSLWLPKFRVHSDCYVHDYNKNGISEYHVNKYCYFVE